jgi:hypothetical protein
MHEPMPSACKMSVRLGASETICLQRIVEDPEGAAARREGADCACAHAAASVSGCNAALAALRLRSGLACSCAMFVRGGVALPPRGCRTIPAHKRCVLW